MKPIVFRKHALDRMDQNHIPGSLVEAITRSPVWAGPDPDRPGIERRYGRIPGWPGKWLRVACVEEKDHIRILSVFPDRNARPPDAS